MLHFLSFIWICLLLAAIAGYLLGLWWLGRSRTSAVKPEQENKLQKDLDNAKRSLMERDKQLEGLKLERDKQLEALKAELSTAKTDRDRVRAEAIPLNARIDELTLNLEKSEKLRVAAEGKVQTVEAKTNLTDAGSKTLGALEAIAGERDQLKGALAKAQDQLAAHTQALTQANTNIQTANATIQTAQAQLNAQETRLQQQAAELTRLRTAPSATATTLTTASGLAIAAVEQNREDDLKEIVGVGPFIESKLHTLGIRTFKQIALLSPEMLERVAEHIEHFQGRIGRENWTEQCKALHFDKYGEKI
jgi:predicted flap endonuclease-1-like 5' DNA nuclease